MMVVMSNKAGVCTTIFNRLSWFGLLLICHGLFRCLYRSYVVNRKIGTCSIFLSVSEAEFLALASHKCLSRVNTKTYVGNSLNISEKKS